MTTPAQIFAAVADAFGVPRDFYLSPKRNRSYTEARFAAWHIIRNRKRPLPFAEIGDISGNRDHSVVSHGVERAMELLASNEGFREVYDAALAEIDRKPFHITTIYT